MAILIVLWLLHRIQIQYTFKLVPLLLQKNVNFNLFIQFTNFPTGKKLPVAMKYSSKMTTTANGRGLIISYEQGIYSFECKSQQNCFWTKEEIELQISRRSHMMITVPSTLVDNCDCDLDTNGNCRCPAGVTGGECGHCKKGYWGLDANGCKSKFYLSL